MLVLQLAIILIASKIAGSLSVRLGQPSVLGKLLVGILLGPSVLGLITETQTLAEISQIGVILLMFIAGLETDIHEFRRTGKASVFVGFGGIIFPLALGYFARNNAESYFCRILVFRVIAVGNKREHLRSSLERDESTKNP